MIHYRALALLGATLLLSLASAQDTGGRDNNVNRFPPPDPSRSSVQALEIFIWILTACSLAVLFFTWPATCELPQPEFFCFKVPFSDGCELWGRQAPLCLGMRGLSFAMIMLWLIEAGINRTVHSQYGYFLPLAFVPCHGYVAVITFIMLRAAETERILEALQVHWAAERAEQNSQAGPPVPFLTGVPILKVDQPHMTMARDEARRLALQAPHKVGAHQSSWEHPLSDVAPSMITLPASPWQSNSFYAIPVSAVDVAENATRDPKKAMMYRDRTRLAKELPDCSKQGVDTATSLGRNRGSTSNRLHNPTIDASLHDGDSDSGEIAHISLSFHGSGMLLDMEMMESQAQPRPSWASDALRAAEQTPRSRISVDCGAMRQHEPSSPPPAQSDQVTA